MALEADLVSFEKSMGAEPVDQTVSVSLNGATPKLVLLWCDALTADGFSTDYFTSFGATDFTDHAGHGMAVEDGGDFVGTETWGESPAKALSIFDHDGTKLAEAIGKSATADQFTLTWEVNDGNAYIIHALVLSGGDLSDVKIGSFTIPISTGNTSVTGVGFEPDAEIFITRESGVDGVQFCLGFAISSTERGATGIVTASPQAGVSDTNRRQRTDRCFFKLAGDKGIHYDCDFVSQDADGFTYNVITAPPATGPVRSMYYVAMKGPQFAIAEHSAPTSGTPPFDESYTGIGFQGKAILAASKNIGTSTDVEGHNRLTIGGAVSSTKRGCTFAGDTNDVDPREADRALSQTRVMGFDNISSPSSFEAEADFKTFDTDGYTWTWEAIDSVDAFAWLHLVMGDAALGLPERGFLRGVHRGVMRGGL